MSATGLPLVGVSGEINLPRFLEVRRSPVAGRGLYTKEEIPRGTELFTALPISHVSIIEPVCQNCLRKNENLLKCSACKVIYYCATSCQRNDWSQHKRECAGLRKINPGRPTDTMRLVMRLLNMAAATPAVKQQLDFLMTNEDKMSEEVRAEMAMQVMGVCMLLGDKGEEGRDLHDKQEIFGILGKVMSNSFNVMDSSHEQAVGLAVYGLPSLLNHSCEPNTVAVFNGTKLSLRSVRPIASGNQLTISYYEVMESRQRRREHLQKVYCFNCSCHRCETETSKSSPLRVMYAGKVGTSDDTKKAMEKEGYSLLDDLKVIEKNKDWMEFVKKCSEFIARSCSSLHSMNLVLSKVREQLMRGQLQLETWEDALETGVSITNAYRHCLHDCHPVFVLHLVKMGKLRRVLGSTPHLQQALVELSEAEKLAHVTFGRDNLMYHVKEMLEDTRAELTAREWS